jgi:hypothetical protein
MVTLGEQTAGNKVNLCLYCGFYVSLDLMNLLLIDTNIGTSDSVDKIGHLKSGLFRRARHYRRCRQSRRW